MPSSSLLMVYPTLADVCGLSVPTGLDGVSLKPLLENPSSTLNKVAISQYPRGGRPGRQSVPHGL